MRLGKIRRNTGGFTLIEITIVVVIIGILATLLIPRILDRPERARRTAAKADMRTIMGQLMQLKADTGRYPTTAEGMAALVKDPGLKGYQSGGYLTSVPVDPWENPYAYLCPGREGRDFDLISYGRDGQAGGEGYDADIVSWDLKAE